MPGSALAGTCLPKHNFRLGDDPLATPDDGFAAGYNSSFMTAFNSNVVTDHQLDWTILRDGGVALYWRPEVLAQDIRWLKSNGYLVTDLNAGDWKSEEQMYAALKSALSFPDYFGNNLNALDECMCEDIAVPDEGGLALVLSRYDQFAKAVRVEAAERPFAEIVLHVLAKAVRYHMLFGRRLIVLVQSDDPRVRFEGLAKVAAQWNPREWLAKSRGL